MGDTPVTDNKAIEVADEIIKAANSVGVELVEALAISQVPFLGLPVIKQIFGYILGWLDGYIQKAEEMGASFAIIDIQVGSEESAVSKATKQLVAAQKLGDPHALQLAIEIYAAAISSLIHYDGSHKPN